MCQIHSMHIILVTIYIWKSIPVLAAFTGKKVETQIATCSVQIIWLISNNQVQDQSFTSQDRNFSLK